MTRLLVPELEARRHLIEGYAQFPDVVGADNVVRPGHGA